MLSLRNTLLALATVGALCVVTLTAQASPAPKTGVQMFSPNQHVVLTVHGTGPGQWIEFNPVVYVESPLSQFEIDVRRANAGQPITAAVKVGSRSWPLPPQLVRDWTGLRRAFTVTWRSADQRPLSTASMDWCPNDGGESKVSPGAANVSAFAWGCGSNPFTRGLRWGIDRGWARQVLAYNIVPPPAIADPKINRLWLDIGLNAPLARAIGVPLRQSTVHFVVDIKRVKDGPVPGPPGPILRPQRASSGVQSASSSSAVSAPPQPLAGPGRVRRPIPRDALPDLIALPAWHIGTHSESTRDLLDFSATVYNGGPGPLVAEGFRRGANPWMTAYQYFYRGTHQVGAVQVGTMEYDARPTHEHWHFRDFAMYDLTDKAHRRIRSSGKEAFCLAPTDSIDLLARGAVADPGNGNLSTACGDISSIWVREVLAAGWGDTYSQARAGQSIDITGLPNGTYWIRVTANPAGRLHEATRANNVSLRRVILGGKPGARTVLVPAYGLINSEVP